MSRLRKTPKVSKKSGKQASYKKRQRRLLQRTAQGNLPTMMSNAFGGQGFRQVRNSIDISSNSLNSKMKGSSIGASPGTLGIQGTSGNFYLDSLVDPSRPPVRIPDLYSKQTCVHKSYLYGTLTPAKVNAADTHYSWSIQVNPNLGVTAGVPQSWSDATVTTHVGNGAAGFDANSYMDPDFAILNNLINEVRPVSAYLYVSFVGDTLTDGGQIASCFMPSGSIGKGGFHPILANLQSVELVSNLAVQPGAYVGPSRSGTYVRWSPEDERDSFFYPIGYDFLTPAKETETNQYDYPILVASGTTTANGPVIRWIVEVNYEFTSQSRILTQIPSPINTRLVEHAKVCLQSMPYASANDAHESLWSRFLGWAKGAVTTVENVWNNDIKPVLGPVLGTAGTVFNALGMPEVGAPLSAAGGYLK